MTKERLQFGWVDRGAFSNPQSWQDYKERYTLVCST